MSIAVQNIRLAQKYLNSKNSNKNNYSSNSITLSGQNTNLIDINYGMLLAKKRVSFKGFPTNLNASLSLKFSNALLKLKQHEVLLVGHNLDSASELLKGQLPSLPIVIKKLLFISDDSLKSPFAAFLNEDGCPSLLNLAKNTLKIQEDKAIFSHLAAGESYNLYPGCLVHTDNSVIHYDGEAFETKGLKAPLTYDFSTNIASQIAAVNQRSLGIIGAKTFPAEARKITLADVGGLDSVVDKLNEDIFYPILYPESFGSNVNHGHLLTGPPGTGKSLICEALSNEHNINFVKIDGKDVIEKWVGEPMVRMKAILQDALKKEPCVIVIDEADAILMNRSSEQGQTHINVTNALLPFLSDVEKQNKKVFVLIATNNPTALDPALLRSGRIGECIKFERPNLKGCKEIFAIHSRKVKNASADFDSDIFTQKLYDAEVVGADIAEIVSRAEKLMYKRSGIFQKMKNKTYKPSDADNLIISPEDFDNALKSFLANRESKTGEVSGKRMGFAAFSSQTSGPASVRMPLQIAASAGSNQ